MPWAPMKRHDSHGIAMPLSKDDHDIDIEARGNAMRAPREPMAVK